ncbi:MAG: hypothetical protein Q9195_001578 [Heterodermia aff. obscurata]
MISIKVPCSTANLGPGFDVLGLALSLYLELQITFPSTPSDAHLNCEITCAGLGAENLRTDPEQNLITQVALYVLRCHNQHKFPRLTKVHIINGIPLSRGLGSSGAAVVAGAMLANEIGGLKLPKDRILDFCLMVERHPDNITAALYGGFVGACLSELDPEDAARVEVPLAEVLPEPAGGVDTGKQPPVPPLGIGQFERFRLSSDIKAVVVIPNFKVDTAKAREVYTSQRIAILTQILGQPPTDPKKVHLAMQDRMHQPYRANLVPGAGPTILALATHNFEQIAQAIIEILIGANSAGTQCQWQLLEPAYHGSTVDHDA